MSAVKVLHPANGDAFLLLSDLPLEDQIDSPAGARGAGGESARRVRRRREGARVVGSVHVAATRGTHTLTVRAPTGETMAVRLRIRPARGAETDDRVLARNASARSAAMTVMANRVGVSTTLEAGWPMKDRCARALFRAAVVPPRSCAGQHPSTREPGSSWRLTLPQGHLHRSAFLR